MRSGYTSIRRQLLLLVMLTSGLVVFLTTVGYTLYEITALRRMYHEQVSTLARVIASNAAAPLAFQSAADAKEVLSALVAEPHIEAAALYDRKNSLFATYVRPGGRQSFPAEASPRGHQASAFSLTLYQPVTQAQSVLGTLYLKANLTIIRERTIVYAAIGVLMMAGALLFGFFFAKPLQTRITQPILSLANTARIVSARKDYSLRAHVAGAAEVGVLKDAFNEMLSELQSHEARLRESEERFRIMAETVPDMLFTTDAAGQVDYCSQHFYEYTGLAPGSASGMGWVVALHPEDVDRVKETWMNSVRTGQSYQINYRLRKHDGQYCWFIARASPIRDQRGRISRWFGAVTDIQEMKMAQQEISALNAELEERVQQRTAELTAAVQELETMSYTLVHDLRAPLRALSGFSSMLERTLGPTIDERTQNLLRQIKASALRMDRLITDVLNYSRLSRGQIKIETVDVEALVHEIVDAYPSMQPPRAEVDLAGPFPPVKGNVAALTQCLSNLLGNAVKFVAPGVKPHVRVWAENGGGWLRLCVRDNGIGIARDGQERIFGMFQRLQHERDYEGTGIGLSIVRKAVERMGGRVGVESEPGRGSTFWLELQRAE